MLILKHFDQSGHHALDFQFLLVIQQLGLAHSQQGLLRPLGEPVNRAAVDQRREHSQSRAENISQRTHRDHAMDVLLYANQILSVDVHFVRDNLPLLALDLAGFLYVVHLLLIIDVGDIPRIQNIVNILEHLLVDDLSVHK